MSEKEPNGILKRWHLFATLIFLLIGTGVNIGWNLSRVTNVETSLESVKSEVRELKIKTEGLIEIGVDIRYIKEDIADIKKKLDRRR